jgi:4-hydroxy-tetrahydrodipicolinate reductase
MGKAIETIAVEQGHKIALKITSLNRTDLNAANLKDIDVAIEFTNPHSAVDNIKQCLLNSVPVVCGSTGWLAQWEEVKKICDDHQGSLLYASNFSIGVNIFFALNKSLALLMNETKGYEVSIEEIHHTQKKDAPSGTAITLADGIIQHFKAKSKWVANETNHANELPIISKRIDPAPGTHTITYHSAIDDIEIKHTAHNRSGFAAGAVLAAEFIAGKKGIYSMADVLKLPA